MIPKVIHYCWFGGNPLDDKARKCIDSWEKHFPEYRIQQWNESNFDVSAIGFMRDAYADGKWAFVSDVARFLIIYEYGGIYFDTDVEVISSYEDILTNETRGFIGFETSGIVASGLGFGAEKNHPFLKQLLEVYDGLEYKRYKQRLSDAACTVITTELMLKNGLQQNGQRQNVCGFDIYPVDFFAPVDYYTGQLKRTANTHSIHWYSATWKTEKEQLLHARYQFLNRVFGRRMTDVLIGITSCIRSEGLGPYLSKRARKYLLKKN